MNAPISDLSNGPIVLPFRSNDAYVGRGFRIHYELVPCQIDSVYDEDDGGSGSGIGMAAWIELVLKMPDALICLRYRVGINWLPSEESTSV